MARKIAEDKHQKLVQALILAAVTLLLEHCIDIFHPCKAFLLISPSLAVK